MRFETKTCMRVATGWALRLMLSPRLHEDHPSYMKSLHMFTQFLKTIQCTIKVFTRMTG